MSAPSTAELRQGADQVAEQLRAAGFEAYLAGGCVRDLLRGEVPKDFDLTTNARPEEVSRVFKRTVQVGAAFGVVRVLMGKGREYEVATYRTDGDYSDGRRPDRVEYSTSKEEDVLRRDFTINALLMDPRSDQVIDLVGGRADLAAGLVRAVGDPEKRFGEDRLRMLRAVRFAARFGFTIEPATMEVLRRHASSIVVVSVERIVNELEGIWSCPYPARGHRLLLETGLLPAVLPFLHEKGAEVVLEAEARLSRVPSATAELPKLARLYVAWAALFELALNKDPRLEDAGEKARRDFLEEELRLLKLSRDHLRGVQRLLDATPRLAAPEGLRLADRVRLVIAADWPMLRAYAEVLGSPALRFLDAERAAVEAAPLPPLSLITGEDLKRLGVAPGPAFKEILTAVETEILERRIESREQAMAKAEELARQR